MSKSQVIDSFPLSPMQQGMLFHYLRRFADSRDPKWLKPLSGVSLKGTFKQGVAGSSPARLIGISQNLVSGFKRVIHPFRKK